MDIANNNQNSTLAPGEANLNEAAAVEGGEDGLLAPAPALTPVTPDQGDPASGKQSAVAS